MTMMGLPYWNDQLGKVDPNITRLVFNITGAKASTAAVPNTAQLSFYDALASQAVIDSFLSPAAANSFLVAAFDSTAMGTDAFGCIVNFGGQVKQLLSARVATYSGAGGGTVVPVRVAPVAALTASSLTTQAAVAGGNVAVRAILAGLDALTSGLIEVELEWISK